MTTSRDVARLAGVSQSTVSYVLTGKRPISEETRKRVEGAIEELSFHPNAGARALAGQRTGVIGLVAPFRHEADHSGVLPFIETIASAVRKHDYDLLLVTADEGAAGLRRVVGRRIVDALIIMEIEAQDERIRVAADLDVPVVLIGVPDEAAGLACVDLDFRLAGEMAVTGLTQAGCTTIALIGYPSAILARNLNFTGRFVLGARCAADQHGITLREVAPVELTRASVRAAIDAALSVRGAKARDLTVGLVVAQTEVLPLVLRELERRGIEPGRDVAVVGVCTDETAMASESAVSNVALEPYEVSYRAVSMIMQALERPALLPAAHVDLIAPRATWRASSPLIPSSSRPVLS